MGWKDNAVYESPPRQALPARATPAMLEANPPAPPPLGALDFLEETTAPANVPKKTSWRDRAVYEAPKAKPTLGKKIADSAAAEGRGLLHGATAGFSDELIGALGTAFARAFRPDLFERQSVGDSYKEGRDIWRKGDAAAAEEKPIAYGGGDVMGAVLTPANKLLGAPGGLVKTMAQGGTIGAAQGLGRSEADVTSLDGATQTAIDTGIGGVLGIGGGAVAHGLSKVAVKLTPVIMRLMADETGSVGGKRIVDGAIDPGTAFAVEKLLQDGKTPRQIIEAARIAKNSNKTLAMTVFEAADAPGAQAIQRTASEAPDATGTMFKNFNTKRIGEQLPKVVEDTVYKGATTTSPITAGGNATQAASDIYTSAVKARTKAVAPKYAAVMTKKIPPSWLDSLVENNPVLKSEITKPDNSPVIQQLLKDAADDLGVVEIPQNSVGYLDVVKKFLDGKISSSLNNMGQATAETRALQSARTRLVAAVDKQVPAYASARQAFGDESVFVKNLESGLVGKLTKTKNPDAAAQIVFKEHPERIAEARKQFHASGKGQEWDDLVAAHVGDLTDNSSGSVTSLLNKLGSRNNQISNRIRAAMGEEAYTGQQALIRNLERIQEGLPRNSETVPKAQAAMELSKFARGGSFLPEGSAAGGSMKDRVFSMLESALQRGSDEAAQARKGSFFKAITSPDLKEYAKALRGKTAQQQVELTAKWLESRLASTAGGQGSGYLKKPSAGSGTSSGVPRLTIRPTKGTTPTKH